MTLLGIVNSICCEANSSPSAKSQNSGTWGREKWPKEEEVLGHEAKYSPSVDDADDDGSDDGLVGGYDAYDDGRLPLKAVAAAVAMQGGLDADDVDVALFSPRRNKCLTQPIYQNFWDTIYDRYMIDISEFVGYKNTDTDTSGEPSRKAGILQISHLTNHIHRRPQ
uniref:Uncharacterized protein n=1 Tax=Glossina austeni TaxID=7395 RepID=A0A1A9V7J8_GLOAU